MATGAPTTKRVTLDASFVTAICTKEPNSCPKALAELARYMASGFELYAPSILAPECLRAFCRKLNANELTPTEYTDSVQAFIILVKAIKLPPNGDFALIQRTADILGTYSCNRSADATYIALAEELACLGDAELVTFDQDLEKQAKKHAPTVIVTTLVA